MAENISCFTRQPLIFFAPLFITRARVRLKISPATRTKKYD
jgi:hypothetical protein